jgi:serine phosphatase RsbU (regulator of sigma subunit)
MKSKKYKQLTNCLCTNTWIEYIKHKGWSTENIYEGIKFTENYLCDVKNWMPSKQVHLLMKNISRTFPNEPTFFYDSAIWAATNKSVGPISSITKSFLSPGMFFDRIPNYVGNFNKHRKAEIVIRKKNYALINTYHMTDLRPMKEVCEWTRGLIAAVPVLTGANPADVKETLCELNGDHCCQYEIRWKNSTGLFRRLLLRLSGAKDIIDEQRSELESDQNNLLARYEELSSAKKRIDAYAHNLEEKVIERTQQLIEEKEKVSLTLKNLNDQLEEAKKYVISMLPKPILDGKIKTDWRFLSSESLGGDSFGYHWIDNNKFAFYLVDVSGHGVGAALLSISILNTLRSQSLLYTDFKSPSQVLEALNRTFPAESHNFMFFSIWYGVYDCENNTLFFSSGGHPPALLTNNDPSGKINIQKLKTNNCMIGSMQESKFLSDSIKVLPRQGLYIFSDGVYEFTKPDGSMWSFNELVNLIESTNMKNQQDLDIICNHTKTLLGKEKFDDDFTILKIQFF